MRKFGILLLILAVLLAVFGGCTVEKDLTVLVGSMLPPGAPTPAPTPTPTPGGGYDGDGYGSDSGGGDSGGGIASFSGYGDSAIENFLPDPAKGKATVSFIEGLSILEGQNLSLSDKNLQKALDDIQSELKDRKQFTKFSFLIVSLTKRNDNKIKIKLNDTYDEKVAYQYFVDEKGTIQKLDKDGDIMGLSVILDDKNFANRELTVDFMGKTGFMVYCFGAK